MTGYFYRIFSSKCEELLSEVWSINHPKCSLTISQSMKVVLFL
jgi:hypothetical protein